MPNKCKEMVSILGEQENANKDHNDTAISLAKIPKTDKTTCWLRCRLIKSCMCCW